MALLVYCIVPAAHAPPAGLAGIGGDAVDIVECGDGVAAWVSAAETESQAATEAALAHHRVIVAAMDTTVTPVPLRFGQAFAGVDATAAAIGRDAGRWQRELRRFAGRAEYGVRVSRKPGQHGAEVVDAARDVHPPPPESGTAYMAALAARHAQAERAREEMDRLAACLRGEGFIEESRNEPLSGVGLVSMAHLVAWENADAYHAAMRRLRDANDHLEFLFTGPWPPYSFVE